MSNNETTFTNHNGGCAEIQYSGDQTGNATIKPNLAGAERGMQINSDGTTRDLGPKVVNGQDLRQQQQGLSFYSQNGAKRVFGNEINRSSMVNIPGVGMMAVGAALHAGLLQTDALGNFTDTSKEGMEKLQDKGQQTPSEVTSFASQDIDNTLNALDAAIGREGTYAAANSVISHLTSDKHATTEEIYAKAGMALAQRSGVDPEVAQAAVQEMYDGYRQQAADYLTKQGVDAEAVFDYASKLSSAARADIMRGILLGKGPQVLNNLVKRMKNKDRW